MTEDREERLPNRTIVKIKKTKEGMKDGIPNYLVEEEIQSTDGSVEKREFNEFFLQAIDEMPMVRAKNIEKKTR